ncbi:conjugative transposon protein TraM [Mucilaginibacter sp. dw_454]|uniref:conjugative transposon protein TraM n=1 Tax=Mucilaginibacter sp. dw_454 TaxID=2720079 RepID=UPI001BD6361D|nr:conjugative transposon protein TraM [Mucilaginibacter sp. dw_454]
MEHSEKYLKKRKALLVLPLLALPFVTLAFWSLGGGKGVNQAQAQEKPGINTSLPSPQLSGASLDKMSLYNKAAIDSQNLKNQLSRDPFAGDTIPGKTDTSHLKHGGITGPNYSDPNEAKVRTKLAQLEQSLNQPQSQPTPVNNAHDPAIDAQLARLQQSMQQLSGNNEPDPQMQQMNAMLEKVLDIQHPERLQQQLRQQSLKNKGRVYPVTGPDEIPHSGFTTTGFYGLDDNAVADSSALPAIPAVVQETQTVTTGATIKLRLTEDVMVNGTLIPKNNFVYGSCNIDGERLKISITGIRYNNSVFPVGLSVYDLDALEGIRVPGAIGRDASKEGADRGVQSMQLMSLDPSLGAQAASAGLEAVKGFASKKVKLVRVTVKAGYPVLLLDGKAKQDSGN